MEYTRMTRAEFAAYVNGLPGRVGWGSGSNYSAEDYTIILHGFERWVYKNYGSNSNRQLVAKVMLV